MTRIFISYRRDDTKMAAGRISDHLKTKFGKPNVFMDVNSIEPGDDFIEVIEQAVGQCDVLIAVIGDHWLNAADKKGRRRLDNVNDFVRVEISTALKRGIRVIPVLIDDAEMVNPDELPDDLKALTRRNGVTVDSDDFETDIAKVISAVEKTLATTTTAKPRTKSSKTQTEAPNAGAAKPLEAKPLEAQTPAVTGKPVAELPKANQETVPPKPAPQAVALLKHDIRIDPNGQSVTLLKKGIPLPASANVDANNLFSFAIYAANQRIRRIDAFFVGFWGTKEFVFAVDQHNILKVTSLPSEKVVYTYDLKLQP